MARRKVLITGAAGRIGRVFAEATADRYELTLLVRKEDGDVSHLGRFGKVVVGDIADLDGLKAIFEKGQSVVHMAGEPSPEAVWADLLSTNIVGTYHVFAAAKAAGVAKVIVASSIHAVSGYPPDHQVHTDEPVNPGDLYGVSKCFGEALARYMAEKEGVPAICLRIGGFQPDDKIHEGTGVSMLDAWVSHRDLVQLIVKCVEADAVPWAIFHGVSDNRFKRLDITDARRMVGYAPQDDSTKTNDELRPLHLGDRVNAHSIEDGMKSGLREQT